MNRTPNAERPLGVLVACPECHRLTWPNLGVNLPAGAAVAMAAADSFVRIRGRMMSEKTPLVLPAPAKSSSGESVVHETGPVVARVEAGGGPQSLGLAANAVARLLKHADPVPTEPKRHFGKSKKVRRVTAQDRRAMEKRIAKRRAKKKGK